MEQWFVLDVNPEPWEIGPLNVVRKNGTFRPFVGRSQQLDDYKKSVREAIEKGDQPYHFMEGKLSLTCWFWRHMADYESPSARRWRSHEADATNMLKATEDALQGLLYHNDKDNVRVQGYIVAQGPDVEPGLILHLRPAPTVFDILSLIPPGVLSQLAKKESTPSNNDWPPSDPTAFF